MWPVEVNFYRIGAVKNSITFELEVRDLDKSTLDWPPLTVHKC